MLLFEDLVVRPDCRNCGFGSFLLDHVIRFARHGGYHRITLRTDRINADAQRFYSRHGFTVSDMVPHRLPF